MFYRPGETVGSYQIIASIGVGGMGAVYKVRNLITDRVEAMKVLLPNLQSAPDFAERFSREIKVHASLFHPNIASLLTAFRLEDQLLMIMEMVEGVSLAERLRQGPVGISESLDYGCQVLSALSYAHARGVIHRDIKPANIMITPAGRAKLMDFGIAVNSGSLAQKLTVTGMAVGSLHYISPEQVRCHPLDGRSDLYSFGITLYQMVTGQCPIQGDSEYSIMTAQLNTVPASPSQIDPAISSVLSAVILRSIKKEPDARFQTADEFKLQLESLSPGADRGAHNPTHGAIGELPSRPENTPAEFPELSPEVLKAATTELAFYIGPIARVLVHRAARESRTMQELYQAVAKEISSGSDRDKFLTKVR
jgi:serine/threonine protein kinase